MTLRETAKYFTERSGVKISHVFVADVMDLPKQEVQTEERR